MPIESVFSPEVTEYMTLNGYTLISHDHQLDVLTFRRGDVGVVFWQDKIERRIISPDKTAVTRHLKSFKGFDGKDVFALMMILHLLGAVNLKEVRNEVKKCLAPEFSDHLFNELNIGLPNLA